MDTVMLISTIADLSAVAVLAWLLLRGARVHEGSVVVQREALATLRDDITRLLSDAEQRSEVLETALRSRERSLRVLVAEAGRIEGRQDRQPAGEIPVMPLTRPAAASARRRTAAQVDPAEERLLRELATSFPARGA
jgi:hypothetical protein